MSFTGRVEAAAHPSPGDRLPEEAVAVIRERCDVEPAVAIVLGSGLAGAVDDDLAECHDFAYQGLPGFPPPSVPGHAGRLSLGHLHDVPAAVFRGRVHLYEGHGVTPTTLVARLAAALGAETLILTNAAGGLRDGLRPGQLMLISDHLNLLGVNPLAGWRWPDGTPAFVDLHQVYDPSLRESAVAAADGAGLDVAAGVYAALSGPAYETPAEIRYLKTVGADAVGMSTVPEAVAATALGLRVFGVSCITNMAGAETSHEEVLTVARTVTSGLRSILRAIVPQAGAVS